MAKGNKLRRVAEKQAKDTGTLKIDLSLREVALLGLNSTEGDAVAHVNLKYYWPEYQCFSTWTADELKSFSNFCRKMKQLKWRDIYKTGGALGLKTGVGYTPHKNIDKLPANPELADFSPDLTWFELRVDGESRVHGFRAKEAFFLVFLDREHAIYPA
jgi:hypothetical protein